MKTKCVLYSRSSKDDSAIACQTQAKELRAFATSRGYVIAGEHADSAVSANDNPPKLRALLRQLDNPERGWTVILCMDASRIARDADLAGEIGMKMRRAGCAFEFLRQPSTGNASADVILQSVERGRSAAHSIDSREKGVAGMRHTVENGHRAGGRAPFGYQLKHTEVGRNRRGNVIRRSTLVVDPRPAKLVAAFLKARAAGVPRHVAAKTAKLEDKAYTSLLAVERNSLCYAGFLVWNQRRKDRTEAGKTMRWRPRSEWSVSETPIHPALITRQEADAIAKQVDRENPLPKGSRPDRKPGRFLLTGVLVTPDGTHWQADQQ